MLSTDDQPTARARVRAGLARTPVEPGNPLKRMRLFGSRPIGTSTNQIRLRGERARHHHEAGGISIQPMHDARTRHVF